MQVSNASEAFWFVTVISNPMMYRSRSKLYKDFKSHVLNELKANLLTVELGLGERDPHVVDIDHGTGEFPSPSSTSVAVEKVGDREIHVLVRGETILWHKENMVNIGIASLPASCKYVAWVDADVHFLNREIVRDTIHQLQLYKVVQMFQNSLDMGPAGEVMQIHQSFGHCWATRKELPWAPRKDLTIATTTTTASAYYYNEEKRDDDDVRRVYWHPGYAWAARVDTLNQLGGLFDLGIVGAGDHHMACAMIGHAGKSVPGNVHENYRAAVLAFGDRCAEHVRCRVSYVAGTITHGFHGFKHQRGYKSRWDILVDHAFDPLRDIKRNLHGVIELVRPESDMAHDIIAYFRSRNEDVVVA